MNSGIYKIKNLVNDSFYIGSAVSLNYRKNQHWCKLRKNKHPNKHLQNAWNKYEEQNFVFEIIEFLPKDDLIEKEQNYIDTLKPKYNKREIAKSNFGMKWTEETKRKMSESRKGDKNCNYGKHLSEETKQKLRDAMVGGKLSEDHRKKISAAVSGEKHPMYGKHHTEETKKKMSKSKIGKVCGENVKTSKLTWNDVEQIRKKYIPQKYGITELAREFDVYKTTISNIINNKTWKI